MTAPARTRTSAELIRAEEPVLAHNYHPLPVVVASADGAWMTDVEGRRYLDLLAGYSALNFGHRNRRLVATSMVDADGVVEVKVLANSQVVAFCEARGQQILNGSYEYVLRKENGSFRIARKKILLLEYVIDGYFDFFTI